MDARGERTFDVPSVDMAVLVARGDICVVV